jgi:hypothetical protein
MDINDRLSEFRPGEFSLQQKYIADKRDANFLNFLL